STARDLWKVCSDYGTVVDVFIPFKRYKSGKRFAFVRFIKLIQATNSFENDERIVWISIEGLPIKAWTPNTFRKIASLWGEYVEWEEADLKSLSCKNLCLKTNMKVIINERQKVIIQGKVYWIHVKELDAWFPNFHEDDQDDLSLMRNHKKVIKLIIMRVMLIEYQNRASCMKTTLLTKMSTVAKKESDEPKFPPGFTPDNNDQEKNMEENIKDTTERVQSLSNKHNDSCSNREFSSQRSMNSHSQKSKVGGSILDLMDELVTIGQTMGYNMAEQVSTCDYFVALMGTWAPTFSKLLIISVDAPQGLNERRDLWDYLRTFIDRWEGDTVIMGDFTEMQSVKDNQVWRLVDLPPNGKTISSKWIFKKKIDMDGNVHTYKARLVAKGYTQIYEIDYEEMFSHVVDIRAIRILIAIATFYDYEIWQMDVKTAFLNGYLNENIYMVQPEGFIYPKYPTKVCKLQRSIYGLKQALRI
nr:putative retrotransposon Ty1-copia subclass protein [Tanacetum cinerariifolium]